MVCIGVITLTQTASAALITGLLTFLIGLFIQFKGTKEWSVLSSCCSISGVLIFAAGINLWVLWAYESDFLGLANSLDFLYAQILTTLILMVASAFLLSNILATLSILSTAQLIGAGTSYFTGSYTIWVSSPVTTIVVFSALAFLLYYLSVLLYIGMKVYLLQGQEPQCLLLTLGSGLVLFMVEGA
ncbi:MAG: hypothetical protein CM15mP98_11950 [Paracoccaceae bacterium]|nr:MAG: hypothetical protein CM15mP98_11950 [Paracoccaceae bacterium]